MSYFGLLMTKFLQFTCPGEFVAQYKQTVILMPNGPLKITGLPIEEDLYKSELSVTNPESVVSVATISL